MPGDEEEEEQEEEEEEKKKKRRRKRKRTTKWKKGKSRERGNGGKTKNYEKYLSQLTFDSCLLYLSSTQFSFIPFKTVS